MPGLTGHLTTPTVIPNVLNRHARLDLNVMPGLTGHLTTPTVIPNVLNRHARLDLTVMPGLTGHLSPNTMQKKGYIYFMTNQTNKVLYTGVTDSLKRRVTEHFEGRGSVFTSKYNCNKLVYFEQFPSIEQAIAREKQLKHFKREWKNQLVETINPQWNDLSHSIIDDPDLT